jgi:hypothetical protein
MTVYALATGCALAVLSLGSITALYLFIRTRRRETS